MRILQINSVCGIGSTGRIATDIHQILEETGHESYIAYGRGEAINCANNIKIGNKIDNYIHVGVTRFLDRHGFASERATKALIQKIEELSPDLIHLHNIHGYYLNIKILFNYLKRTNKPIVWTLHDCWSFTGHCAYFDYVECEKWKDSCYACPQKKEYPTSLILDSSKLNFNQKKELFAGIKNLTIVTPSKWLAEIVKQSFLKEYPVEVINNGIDLSVFKPQKSDFRKNHNLEEKFLILGVANVWDRRKGLNYFIKLAEELKDDEIIILVGITEEQKRELPNNVFAITRTNNSQELAEIYSSANVFVNPTLEDNFPTTNLEALACGTPIITFNTGGSVESITEKTGFVIGKSDWRNVLRHVREVKSEMIQFKERELRNIAIRNYGLENFQKYLKIYENLLK